MALCPGSGPGSAVCSQMPLFATRGAGLRWRVDHPGVAIVDLADACDIAHTYVRNVKDT